MESVGELMVQARERMGVTLEQASRDTLISRRYLDALEREDFSVLPGDAYVAGFIHNYSSYLNLDPDEMVSLYRNLLLQEQPIPIKELLESDRGSRARLLAGLGGAVAIAAAAFAVYWFAIRPGGDSEEPAPAPEPASVTFVALEDEVTVAIFDIGTVIEVPIDGGTGAVPLTLRELDGDLLASYPDGELRLRVGGVRLLDLDGDDRPDLSILVRDADASQTPPQVQLRLDLLPRPGVASSSTPLDPAGSGGDATAQATSEAATAEEGAGDQPAAEPRSSELPAGTASSAPVRRLEIPHAVAQVAAARVPFAVDLTFRGNCLLRYVVDGGASLQRFFQTGEQISIEVNQSATLWLSNAGVVTARFAGTEVALGENGAVAAKQVEWAADGAQQRLLVRTLF